MPADDLHKPHDKFFKQVFGRPETAGPFFEAHLPQWAVKLGQWSRLERMPGSFIDTALRHEESDLLFRVPFKDQFLYLYCLFEHQRRVDPLMALRLLSYMVQIWKQLLRENPKLTRLPLILPVVLYQGATGWTAPVCFRDLLGLPQEAPEVGD